MRRGWAALLLALVPLAGPGPAWSQTASYELVDGYVIDLPTDHAETRLMAIPLPGRAARSRARRYPSSNVVIP